jgi:hypothetical protein
MVLIHTISLNTTTALQGAQRWKKLAWRSLRVLMLQTRHACHLVGKMFKLQVAPQTQMLLSHTEITMIS